MRQTRFLDGVFDLVDCSLQLQRARLALGPVSGNKGARAHPQGHRATLAVEQDTAIGSNTQ
jgi:hypothetical protein